MASPPSATPAAPRPSGSGCLLLAIGLPVVILIGVVVGTVLRREDTPSQDKAVTVDAGTIGATSWRVDAVHDVEGDTCAFLYKDGEQLTGGCALSPDDATIGGKTVVFGRAAADTERVRVSLSDGTIVDIDTVTIEGMDGRFYVDVVDGDVDAEGLAAP